MKQQILGRIARQGELREQDKVRPELRTGTARRGDHARRVAVHIANQEVELCECDFEGVAHESAWREGNDESTSVRGGGLRHALSVTTTPPADLLFPRLSGVCRALEEPPWPCPWL